MRNVIETIVSEMKKLEKNYLRIYGNLNQSVYSDDEKKVFLESLLNIAFDVFNHKNLRFDISGSGYGISKGDNLLSEKAFQNKLLKKGFTNLNGITIHSSDHTYKSGFDLFTNPNLLNRIDIYFSWPLILNLDKSIDILEKISDSIKLDYAYAYQADNTLSESGEWKVTSSLFSTTATFPKQEQKWEEQMQNIKTGFVKKLYPINAFNPKQIENLNFLSPIKKIKLKDKNEIWVFDDKLVDIQNAKIATKVL